MKKRLINSITVILGLALIGGALALRQSLEPSKLGTGRVYSIADLALADGKNGHDCLVAIDAQVYEIKGFALWEMGQHTPSNGQAYCGADLSAAIDKAPHGRSKLQILPIVGTLK